MIYAVLHESWRPYVTGISAVLGFLVFGPIAEELLFRGAVFELAQRAFPHATAAPVFRAPLKIAAKQVELGLG